MSLMQDYLKQAIELRAEEIIFDSHHKVYFRSGAKTLKHINNPDRTQKADEAITSFLSENEKKMLHDQARVDGYRVLPKIKFSFSFEKDFSSQHQDAVAGAIRIQYPQKTQWGFSSLLCESFHRGEGLHLLVGPKKSGKSSALREIIMKAPQDKVLVVFSDDAGLLQTETSALVKYQPMANLLTFSAQDNVDTIVIDAAAASSDVVCEQALALAEQGYGVVVSLTYSHLEMAVQRFLDHCQGSELSRQRRLSWVLKTILHVKLVSGLEAPLFGVYELVLVNTRIKQLLLAGDFCKIQDLIESSQDKTGMRTLNQSLFQAVIQRKTDIKTAFTVSPDPEKLDAMLKKAGI